MYFVSIEIYSGTNGSTSIELLRAEQKMIKCFLHGNELSSGVASNSEIGCEAVECCRSPGCLLSVNAIQWQFMKFSVILIRANAI